MEPTKLSLLSHSCRSVSARRPADDSPKDSPDCPARSRAHSARPGSRSRGRASLDSGAVPAGRSRGARRRR